MSERHAPEPWEAFTDCPGECCWMIRTVEDDEGHSELICSPETDEVNARRIVACVNACAGISTEGLERGSPIIGANQLLIARCAEIERKDAVIAELLEILKDCSESLGSFCSDEGWGQIDMDRMDSADAAIARFNHDPKAQ